MKQLLIGIGFFTLVTALHAATLVWDANTETNLAGYMVYVTDGTNQNTWDVGLETRKGLSSLGYGATYTLYVTAYNTDGIESDPSASVTYTPVAGLPPVPVFGTNRVKATPKNFEIDVAWVPVAGAYGATNYMWAIIQAGQTVASGATTNTSAHIIVPKINPTFFTLYTTNVLGKSQSLQRTYAQPKSVAPPSLDFSLIPPPTPPLPK